MKASTGELAVRRMTPFGEDRGSPPSWWPGQRGFVGGTRDETIGLVHLGAREYDPRNGRFLSVDPIIDPEEPQQLNAYAYANNSPVTLSDPDGQWVWFAVAARVAMILAARAAARRLAAWLARRRAAQEAARRAAREAAKRRAAAEAAKRKAAEAKRKKAAEEAAKRRQAAAAKKRAEAAKRRAAEKRKRAAQAAQKRRVAAAAKRRKEIMAQRRQLAAKVRNSRRASRSPARSQQRHRPGTRPTSHRAAQRQSPPRARREPVRPQQSPPRDPSSQPGPRGAGRHPAQPADLGGCRRGSSLKKSVPRQVGHPRRALPEVRRISRPSGAGRGVHRRLHQGLHQADVLSEGVRPVWYRPGILRKIRAAI
ncbi:RHS repeat-associated core domain-containing protein [Nonomuraea ferruginea]